MHLVRVAHALDKRLRVVAPCLSQGARPRDRQVVGQNFSTLTASSRPPASVVRISPMLRA